MKNLLVNPPVPYLATMVGGLGGIIFSQALSFGWPSKFNPVFSSHDQAVCVALSGLGLLILANFVRHTLSKLDTLEKELAQMKAGTVPRPGGSSL